MASSRFDNFSQADYDTVFAFLSTGFLNVPATPENLEAFIMNLGYTVPAGLIDKI